MSFSNILFLIAGLSMGQTASAVEPAPLSMDALASNVEAKYRSFSDITMDFEQVYLQKARGKTIVEKGVLRIKRPRKMSWNYTEPKQKLFVTDGQKATFYMVEESQAIVDKSFGDNKLNKALSFLWGEGQLQKVFATHACMEEQKRCPKDKKCQCLGLVPVEPLPEVEEMRLFIENDSLIVLGALMIDSVGNETTYLFSNIKPDTNVGDEFFQINIPAGVTVLDQGTK